MRKSIIKSMTMLALMLVSVGAWAQTGTTPLVNSTHTYSVTAGNASNTLAWTVTTGTVGVDYSFTTATDGQSVGVKWLKAGSYTLQFSETASSCTTVRTIPITVSANTFDVYASATSPQCNGSENVANVTGDGSTTIVFTINMATGITSWNPNWHFTYDLSADLVADPSAKIVSTQVGAGAATTVNATTYSGNSGTISGGSNGVATVDITVVVSGDVNTAQNVTLSLSNGVEEQFSTPALGTTASQSVTQVINPLPATSTITAN